MSRFIEMFGDPILNSKQFLTKKGNELFVFSSGKANIKGNLAEYFPYPCYGGNGITGHSKDYLVDTQTLVVGRVGEYCGSVHAVEGKAWITDNAIYIKEYKGHDFDFKFLYFLFTILNFHRLANETGQPKITQSPLLTTNYIVPPMEQQQQFVSIAEQADKSGFVGIKSRFIEMFGGCKQVVLKDVAYITKTSINPTEGITYTLFSFPAFDNNKTPEVVDGAEIKSSKINLEDDVILYNKLNVRLCRVWNIGSLESTNNICSSEFIPVRSKDISILSKAFLYRILCSEVVTQKMVACSTGTSNSQKRITPSSLMNMLIPLPPMKLQQQFVSIAEQADKSGYGNIAA